MITVISILDGNNTGNSNNDKNSALQFHEISDANNNVASNTETSHMMITGHGHHSSK